MRTLVQNLRVGAGWRSVVPALARASVLAREGRAAGKARLEQAATAAGAAFHLCPSLEVLVPALLEVGVDGLAQRCTLTPGGAVCLPVHAAACWALGLAAMFASLHPFAGLWLARSGCVLKGHGRQSCERLSAVLGPAVMHASLHAEAVRAEVMGTMMLFAAMSNCTLQLLCYIY